jgi:hypothetical protein
LIQQRLLDMVAFVELDVLRASAGWSEIDATRTKSDRSERE